MMRVIEAIDAGQVRAPIGSGQVSATAGAG
jgi:hypothetical protein